MKTAQIEALQYANTIKDQIGRMTLLATGAREFLALPENDEQRGGLQFTVNRTRLTKIVVRLAWNDTYTVEFLQLNPRTRIARVVERVELVYCDNLSEVIYNLSTR